MEHHYSREYVDKVIRERDRAEHKIEKEKSTAREFGEKAVVGLSALAVGFGLGVVEAQNSATAESPYLVGGNVPVDAVAAGLGAIALLAVPAKGPSSSALPVALGAGSAAIGIWGQRAGIAWQQARAGAAPGTTPAQLPAGSATPSSGAYVGYRGAMAPRIAPHGQYGGAPNPYVRRYAG
jgi:hypothetical protein